MSDLINQSVVIVGAGQAGGCCAQGLRRAGHAGSITLIGAESHPPYERPPLSKAVLAGSADAKSTYLKPLAWYADNAVDLRLGAEVVAIDRAGRRLRLTSGEEVGYDALVLATGGRPRRLLLPGSDLPGVVYLRDHDHAADLRARLAPGHKLIIIGGGFIGLEVAATARQAGAEVVVLEAADRLMGRVLPAGIGDWYARLHRGHGVDIRLESQVSEIVQHQGALAVRLGDAGSVAGDTVLVGIGLGPETGLAEAAGLTVTDGVVVDHLGRTSDSAIWAIGDCARFHRPGRDTPTRLESWSHAQNHAHVVAANLTGAETAYDEPPWAWTDQYGINLQVAGVWSAEGETVMRGDPEAGQAVFLCFDGGCVVAGATLDSGREMRPIRRLIAGARPVDRARLGDPTTPLTAVEI